jgi:methionyl-tRNA formyltransferase
MARALAEGRFAVVLQHEADHLDGVLFIDRLAEAERFAFMDEHRASSRRCSATPRRRCAAAAAPSRAEPLTPRGVRAGRRLRVAAFGSPAFALPSSSGSAREHELVLVVSAERQARRPRDGPAHAGGRRPGRGRTACRWRSRTLKRRRGVPRAAAALDLDVAVTAAYGKLLPGAARHPAPRRAQRARQPAAAYRGAAPVQWALIDGRARDRRQHHADRGRPRHRPGAARAAHRRSRDETAQSCSARLAELGARRCPRRWRCWRADALPSQPQDHDAARRIAPRLTRADGRIRWEDDAEARLGAPPRRHALARELVRAQPWPPGASRQGAPPWSAVRGRDAAARRERSSRIDEAGVHVADRRRYGRPARCCSRRAGRGRTPPRGRAARGSRRRRLWLRSRSSDARTSASRASSTGCSVAARRSWPTSPASRAT